ncbi:MAG: amidase, partial [bacterium]|nr:amidase [bacterium]
MAKLRDALDECMQRIRELDPELKAWVEVNPQPALLDGPLRGIGFAAKDIYETRGLATEYGSPIFAGRKGSTDAELVTRLRNLGAILLGKTTTAAFAYFDPPATRNPRNRAHTPGGSSSGSAAAVAAGMVPFALGSQTGGSVIRPASYCGIAGFKPSFGTLPLEGVLPFAPSLDTAGLFTESAADMLDLWSGMGYTADSAAVERLGVLPIPAGVEAPMREALLAATEQLRAAGFQVERIEPPEGFSNLASDVALVMDYEGSRTNRQLWQTHREAIGKKLAQLVARGLKLTQLQNKEALGRIREVRRRMAKAFA